MTDAATITPNVRIDSEKQIQALLEQPAQIRAASVRLAEIRELLDERKMEVKMFEIEVEAEVARKTTIDGKKVFPNEAARAAEVQRILADSGEQRKRKDALDSMSRAARQAEIALEFEVNQFAAFRSIARILGGGV